LTTPSEVLARLRQAVQARALLVFSTHALRRAGQRGVTRHDVLNALLTATSACKQENGTWRIEGLDDDGVELTVIIAFGHHIEIITVF
jgi:hypothetical protein